MTLVIHTPQTLDLTKPLQTKAGKPVTLFQTDGRGPYPLGGYIEPGITRYYWAEDGKHPKEQFCLENVPEKPLQVEYWYNYYKKENGEVFSTGPFHTHPNAVENVVTFGGTSQMQFICRKRVLVVEGQFDE